MTGNNHKHDGRFRSSVNTIQTALSLGHPNPRATKLPRILLAEDDEAVSRLLRAWLQSWGYFVVTAKNGDDARKILSKDDSPELVIMDWMMPGINGVELCREVRRGNPDFYRYILLITSRNNKKDVACALEAGADDYLVKPFGPLDLRSRLTVATRILSVQTQLIAISDSLRVQATVDGLTGVWNRTAFLDLFRGELDRAARSATTTGLLILDLDHFKKINDAHGHAAGDTVLKEVAARLKGALRPYDSIGRYGGEEFLIALPGASRNQLCDIAERIRRSVVTDPIHHAGIAIKAALSIGAVEVTPGDKTALEAIAIADLGLYHAKSIGRNRTVYCQKSWQDLIQSDDADQSFCKKLQLDHLKHCMVSVPGQTSVKSPQEVEPWIMYPYRTEVSAQQGIA